MANTMPNTLFPQKLKVQPLFETDTRRLVLMPDFPNTKSSLTRDLFMEHVRTNNLRVVHVCLEATL